ncbi:class I SAM-dependent methyltransferase [Oenococcus sp. UCMA 16435]|nr:class I SAM-dependent methyltransferase [Oenococcus sp. UCMA 16435]MDI4584979.1 methyltransferase domain-containing protein [Oenococcus sp. UCMA 14587]
MKKNYEKLSQKYYDKIAGHFDFSISGFFSYPFKRLINHNLKLKNSDCLLDVGCANGRLLGLLGKQAEIIGTGIDISGEMISIAKQKYPEYRFACASSEKIPFKNEQFDYIICSASFHHFPDPVYFLNSIKRFLKADGRLIIAEINIPIFHSLYNDMIVSHSKEGDVKAYKTSELINLFQENSFKILKKEILFQIQYYELSL